MRDKGSNKVFWQQKSSTHSWHAFYRPQNVAWYWIIGAHWCYKMGSEGITNVLWQKRLQLTPTIHSIVWETYGKLWNTFSHIFIYFHNTFTSLSMCSCSLLALAAERQSSWQGLGEPLLRQVGEFRGFFLTILRSLVCQKWQLLTIRQGFILVSRLNFWFSSLVLWSWLQRLGCHVLDCLQQSGKLTSRSIGLLIHFLLVFTKLFKVFQAISFSLLRVCFCQGLLGSRISATIPAKLKSLNNIKE